MPKFDRKKCHMGAGSDVFINFFKKFLDNFSNQKSFLLKIDFRSVLLKVVFKVILVFKRKWNGNH